MKDPHIIELSSCSECPFKTEKMVGFPKLLSSGTTFKSIKKYCAHPSFENKKEIKIFGTIAKFCPIRSQRIVYRVKPLEEI